MGDADGSGYVLVGTERFQINHLSFCLIDIQAAVRVDQCDPRAVVSSVFKPFQAFYQNGISLTLRPDITYYTTHILNTFFIRK